MPRGPGQHKAVLNLRLPQAERDEIERAAKARGQTVAVFVRDALNAVLRVLRQQNNGQHGGATSVHSSGCNGNDRAERTLTSDRRAKAT